MYIRQGKCKKTFRLIAFLMIFLLVSPLLAAAEEILPFPAYFYGTLTVTDANGGSPVAAPAGLAVTAKIDGRDSVDDTLVTTEVGKYGGPLATDTKLVVGKKGDVPANARVLFFVSDVKTAEESTFVSYDVKNLPLTVKDETGPKFENLSPAPDTNAGSGRPVIGAAPVDALAGVDQANMLVSFQVDGSTVTPVINGGRVEYTPASPLAAGAHSVQLTARDKVGNEATRSWNFTVAPTDVIPPAYQSAALSGSYKVVTLTFSKNLVNNTAGDSALKAAVTFAADGASFNNLSGSDSVAISGNTLKVTFASALTKDKNKIRVAAGALKDTDGNVLAGVVTTEAIVAPFAVIEEETYDIDIETTVDEDNVIIALTDLNDTGSQVAVTLKGYVKIDAGTTAGDVEVKIPTGTTITGPADWDGTINVPRIENSTSVVINGETLNSDMVVEIGFGDKSLTFNKAVRILMPDQAGKRVGYFKGANFTEITAPCDEDSQLWADGNLFENADPRDAKRDAGNDLVVWTKHFTRFVTLGTPTEPGTSGGGGGGGGVVIVPALTTFTDLAGHWAEKDIAELVSKGVISGYPDQTFKPEQTITRAEFSVILARALSLPVQESPALDFTDVAAIPDWAQERVSAAVGAGLIKGYPTEGDKLSFQPENPITRAEIAVMVTRALKSGDSEGALSFADAAGIPDWASAGVSAAVAQGIVKGYSEDNTFRSDSLATRAEAAVMVWRLMQKI